MVSSESELNVVVLAIRTLPPSMMHNTLCAYARRVGRNLPRRHILAKRNSASTATVHAASITATRNDRTNAQEDQRSAEKTLAPRKNMQLVLVCVCTRDSVTEHVFSGIHCRE